MLGLLILKQRNAHLALLQSVNGYSACGRPVMFVLTPMRINTLSQNLASDSISFCSCFYRQVGFSVYIVHCLTAGGERTAAPEPTFFTFTPDQGRKTEWAGDRFLAATIFRAVVFQRAGAFATRVAAASVKGTEFALALNHAGAALWTMRGIWVGYYLRSCRNRGRRVPDKSLNFLF